MIPLAPVLAGIGDFIVPLLFVLVFIISIIGQIMSKWREAQQQAQRRAQQQRVPPQQQRPDRGPIAQQRPVQRPAAPPKPAAAGGKDPLKDEISEFLRRAAQRRSGAPTQPAPRPGAPPAAAPISRSPQRPRPAQKPVTAEIAEPRPAPIAAQPRRIGAKPVGTAGLGRDVDMADERMKQHLQSVFSHHVGTLDLTQTEAAKVAAAAPTAAVGLAAMLQDPLALRQAIVLTEIFNRPEHRW